MISGIDTLIRVIPAIEQKQFGTWAPTEKHAGNLEDPIVMPCVIPGDAERQLVDTLSEIVERNPELGLHDYQEVIGEYGLEWSDESLRSADASAMDVRGILALILSVIRADRFSEGILLEYLNEGIILEWLYELERKIN